MEVSKEQQINATPKTTNPPADYVLTRVWPKLAVVLLGLVGFGVAGYLTYHHYQEAGKPVIFCITGGQCEQVTSSDYAYWLGIPVAVFGLVGYVALTLVALAGLQATSRPLLLLTTAQLAVAGFGFAASLYFTSVEAFALNAWCSWCVISALLMTLIFALSITDRLAVRRWSDQE